MNCVEHKISISYLTQITHYYTTISKSLQVNFFKWFRSVHCNKILTILELMTLFFSGIPPL